MALTMSLLTLGIGPGDEVIVPNRTFMATAHAALILGAKVRLVDVLPDRPLLDVAQVEAAITPRTKAVLAVHLNGRAVDMPALKALAPRHNLKVVEDAAQAFLSKGSFGWLGAQSDFGCFSLGMTKLVSTGQGGFVVTRDESLYHRMRRVQCHGVVDTLIDTYEMLGSNFKFNDVLASIGARAWRPGSGG
jgi:dTDP-4-amino-4,6-dideoxygalactose transaminase